MPRFVYLFLLIVLLSCEEPASNPANQYQNQCQKIKDSCQLDCVDKTFRACFLNSKVYPDGPKDILNNCHAVHVGSLCAPCEQIFSVSFGGAMRAVSCEEFFAVLDKKNKDKNCSGCLKQFGDSPFAY